ncbi:MAG: DUF1036 domain-containing protein [Pseudomonadota bacterium]
MTRLTALLPLGFALIGLTAPAKAGDVCNETSFMIEIAMAWRTPSGLAAEGWTSIRPGECAEAGPTSDVEQYLYARTTQAYLGGVREWRGGQTVCIDADNFAFEGVADCAAQGLDAREFRRLSSEERERAVLVEAENYGARASDAGLQRLLQAAGYDVRTIDGYVGRRTRREIGDFEIDVSRRFGDDRGGLVDALHEAALARNARTGLRICNDASFPIGAAIARTVAEEEAWESRGWWRIQPGACVRALAEPLEAGSAHVFAQRLAPGELPVAMTGGQEAFCIAPARFSALGRNDCAERSYDIAQFRPAPEPVEGAATARFTDADFGPAP